MTIKYEYELEAAVIPLLKKKGFRLSKQVPISNRLIDVAAINNDDLLICIEFKLHNWTKALEQAFKSKNSFDYVYICLPKKSFSEVLRIRAQELGIGIFIYDANSNYIDTFVEPNRTTAHWLPNKNYIRNYILSKGELCPI